MAISVKAFTTYNGSYAPSHSLPALNSTGSNTFTLAMGINRNPAADVTGWDFNSTTPTDYGGRVNTNTTAIQTRGSILKSSSLIITSDTPSYKLQTMIGVVFEGVDQSAPVKIHTLTTSDGWGNATVVDNDSIVGKSGNLLLMILSAQNNLTGLNIPVVGNMSILAQTTNPDVNLGGAVIGSIVADGTDQSLEMNLAWDDNQVFVYHVLELEAVASGPKAYVKSGGNLVEVDMYTKVGGVVVPVTHSIK